MAEISSLVWKSLLTTLPDILKAWVLFPGPASQRDIFINEEGVGSGLSCLCSQIPSFKEK